MFYMSILQHKHSQHMFFMWTVQESLVVYSIRMNLFIFFLEVRRYIRKRKSLSLDAFLGLVAVHVVDRI